MTGYTDQTAEILFPDRPVPLASGEEIVVREFRFLESLKAAPVARPIMAGLQALFQGAEDTSGVPLLEILAVFAAHPDEVIELLHLATGRTDLAEVSAADGHRLLLALWEVNQGFFIELVRMMLWTDSPPVTDTSLPS